MRRASRGVFASGLSRRAGVPVVAKSSRNFELDELARKADALKERFTDLRGHL
jgi:hypothetical protein